MCTIDETPDIDRNDAIDTIQAADSDDVQTLTVVDDDGNTHATVRAAPYDDHDHDDDLYVVVNDTGTEYLEPYVVCDDHLDDPFYDDAHYRMNDARHPNDQLTIIEGAI